MRKYLFLLNILVVFSITSCNNSPSKPPTEKVEIKKESVENSDQKTEDEITTVPSPNQDTLDISPYHQVQLYEHYDDSIIDFSQEFMKTNTKQASRYGVSKINEISDYSFELGGLFTGEQTGAIGSNYRRITMNISYAKIDSAKYLQFILQGFSEVGNNRCDLVGTVTVENIFEIVEDFDYPGQSTMIGKYLFREDSTQKYSGLFKGTFKTSIVLDHKSKTVVFDDSWAEADGYANRTHVGIWKSYRSGKSKKCIWGDYRLPYTFDLDVGDGERIISEKYINNGWND